MYRSNHRSLASTLHATPNRPPASIANTPAIQNGDAVITMPAESKPTPAKNRMPAPTRHNVTLTIFAYTVKKLVCIVSFFYTFSHLDP